MRTYFCGLILAVLGTQPIGLHGQGTGALPLHVVTEGSASTTIILLHGGPGIRHNYLRPEWDALTDMARLVYYDQRGCGRSTMRGPHRWRQHVADLDALVARESPDDPVILAGSSWGSHLALLYAHGHPSRVEALILSGLAPWPDAMQIRAGFSHLDSEDQELFRALRSSPMASTLVLDSVEVANSGGFHPALAQRIGTSCTGAGRATFFSLESAIPESRSGEITVPVLIVRGPLAHVSLDGSGPSVPFCRAQK
jgi:pimeloyl-ACP methyl ester carboxylesterase